MFNCANVVPGCTIVPRTNAEILSGVNGNTAPSKRIIDELCLALKGEIESEDHIEIEEQLYSGSPSDKPPRTYETDGMVKYGATPLLFSGSSRNQFKLKEVYLPRKDIYIPQGDIGQKEKKVTWNGADMLMLDFLEGTKKNPFNFYVGECKLTKEDLFHLAVQFKQSSSISNWPDHLSVLQCPFCARLAYPDVDGDEDEERFYESDDDADEYVMICQIVMQKVGDQLSQRTLPRLCCKDCFTDNLIPNGFDWGTYPEAKGHGLVRVHFDKYHPIHGESLLKAYYLSSLYETTGMSNAASHYLAKRLSKRGSGGGSDMTRLREKILKQKSRVSKNPMVDLRVQEKQICGNCGVFTYSSTKSAKWQNVHYCGEDCQTTFESTHRMSSGDKIFRIKPNKNIVVRDRNVPEESICQACGINASDGGPNPCMCARCGLFICCGPCHGRPEMNGKNGLPAANLSMVCLSCREKDGQARVENPVGIALLELLRRKPTGRHVNHARLVIAQFRLSDTYRATGLQKDVDAAKEEYLWLANNCDYAPAQLALATFYDPNCVKDNMAWAGPSPIHAKKDIPNPPSPFKPDKKLAKRYYDRACEQSLSTALGQVGIMHKTGHGIYKQDMFAALKMLEEASVLGDAKAMANLGRLLMSNGNAEKAVKFFRRAAEYGNYKAMFTVAQLGMRDHRMRSPGRIHMQRLVNDGWAPKYEDSTQRGAFVKICEFYGVSEQH